MMRFRKDKEIVAPKVEEEAPKELRKVSVRAFRNDDGFTHNDMDTVSVSVRGTTITVTAETIVIEKVAPISSYTYTVDTGDLLNETIELIRGRLIRVIKI